MNPARGIEAVQPAACATSHSPLENALSCTLGNLSLLDFQKMQTQPKATIGIVSTDKLEQELFNELYFSAGVLVVGIVLALVSGLGIFSAILIIGALLRLLTVFKTLREGRAAPL